jgi:small conductance mechanosensitive channel
MNPEKLDAYLDTVTNLAIAYAPRVLLAIVTLILGLWIIGGGTRVLRRTLSKRGVDPTLTPFLCRLLNWGFKALLFISVAAMIGIQTTSFIAVLGAAGLAVGLALQGSLANLAGGVLILIFRPYKVGDFIEAQGELGVVKEIQIFTTTLLSPQNRRIIVPNGAVSNGTIKNYSSEPAVRVDTTVGVAYDSDVAKAKAVLLEMVRQLPGVLDDPAPVVAVSELADSSVNIIVRPFCRPADYWDVFFATVEGSKRALDEAGITIPFPQRDVHMFSSGSQTTKLGASGLAA